jgi:hypothetical protein
MINQHWKDLENLIIVAGHAIYVADNFDDPIKDDNWFLQSFQKGEPAFYIEHILNGVNLAVEDSKSLLVFSGGQTRFEAGPKSEALSYWMIADHFNWWYRTSVKLRTTTEEFARDSFENLLFGICRFYEACGKYPTKVSVVSWAFKQKRFNLHADAIRLDKLDFRGVNNPQDLESAKIGEEKAVKDFLADPYGTRENIEQERDGHNKLISYLGDKRYDRNPFNRQPHYKDSCKELKDLLEYTGTVQYIKPLPWKT